MVCYKDIDEAELLVNYYLKHDEERERIKLLGVEKAKKKHTFKNRITEFMTELERVMIEKNKIIIIFVLC